MLLSFFSENYCRDRSEYDFDARVEVILGTWYTLPMALTGGIALTIALSGLIWPTCSSESGTSAGMDGGLDTDWPGLNVWRLPTPRLVVYAIDIHGRPAGISPLLPSALPPTRPPFG